MFGHFRCGNGTNIYTLYPWIHQHCNNRSNDDQTRPITFPDVNPMELSEQGNSNFSMAAGDFLEVYTEPGMLTSTMSGYHADTPITIKAEPSIWPTAAFINIHEHPL